MRAGERFKLKALSIRKQLTIWYSLIVAFALIGFGVFALAVMRQSIYGTVDEQLEDGARAIQVVIDNSGLSSVAAELQKHGELQSVSQLFQVRQFRPFYTGRGMEQFGIPADGPDQHFKSAEYDDVPLRTLTTTASAGNSIYVVQVAEPMDEFLEAVDRFRTAMLFGIPLLLFAAAAGGYWMSLRAMQPVERITLAAGAITPQDLSQRVTVPQTDDELQRLAETLNGMLQRIESAVARITQFTADASHELRTPIALIRTRAEGILDNPRTNDQYRNALQEILSEAERTSSLIENLMLMARSDTGPEPLQFERTDLSARPGCFDAGEDAGQRQAARMENSYPRYAHLGARRCPVIAATAADPHRQRCEIHRSGWERRFGRSKQEQDCGDRSKGHRDRHFGN